MGTEAHVRIDEGVKRGPRRKDPERTKPLVKKIWTDYKPETKRTVLEDAKTLLAQGWTTAQIGEKHNVPGSTVRFWLLNDRDAEEARDAMFDYELTLRGELIDTAPDALALGRAREGFRYWSFLAERRDAKRYGQRLAVESKQVSDPATQELATAAIELLARFREKVVNPEPIALPIKDIGHDEPT